MNRTLNSVLLAACLAFFALMVCAINVEADKAFAFRASGLKQILFFTLALGDAGLAFFLMAKRDSESRLARLAQKAWELC